MVQMVNRAVRVSLRRRAIRASLAAGLVVGLAACGGSAEEPRVDDGADVVVELASAAQDTADAESARMSMLMTYRDTGREGIDGQTIEMDGVLRLDGSVGEFTVNLAALGGQGGQEVDLRIIDGVTYMDFGPLVSSFGDDGPAGIAELSWVKLDPAALGVPDQRPGFDAGQYTSNLEYLTMLTGSDDIVELGEDDLDGVSARRYRVRLDGDALGARFDLDEVAPRLRQPIQQQLEGLAGRTLTIEVWIGVDDHLVRRQVTTLPMLTPAVLGLGEDATMEIDVTYSDFGVEVDSEAPPDDEVTDYLDYIDLMEELA